MKFKTILAILLALISVTGGAQTRVWDNIVTGNFNWPIISITKVSFFDDRTEVFFHLEVPRQAAGDSVPLATQPTLQAGGKSYAVKGATVISLTEPYKIPDDGKVDFSLIFEPIPADTRMIDVAEPNAWTFTNVHDAENQPKGIADTYWRNEATGEWLIGFATDHAIYGNMVWDIVGRTEKKGAYILTLMKSDLPKGLRCGIYSKDFSGKSESLVIKVGKLKKGLRAITIGRGKPVLCSPVTGRTLPDYPTKDERKGFVDNGYREGDSVTIVGWLKDMPKEFWQRYGYEFGVLIENILTDEEEGTYALMDSLGRFTLKMPLLNTSQVLLDWQRTNQSAVLEPGKTYFFLNDFKTGQKLWMGDDVRMQNELLAHPHSWATAEIDRSRHDLDAMTYLAQADSVRRVQEGELEQLVTSHPLLSQRYRDYVAGYYQNLQGGSMMQAGYHMPGFEIPRPYLEYVGKLCWQRAIKPYTLYRDFTTFMRDYLYCINRKRTWMENWSVYDYNHIIASDEQDLSLLNRWKDWMIDANAKLAAATTEEERQKLAEKLNADNADMLAEVDKIVNGPKGVKVQGNVGFIINMKQHLLMLDSLGADQDLKDIHLTQMVYNEIDNTHTSLLPLVIDSLKAMAVHPFSLSMIEKMNDHYLAIENREFDRLVLKSSDNLKDVSEGEALLKRIIEPYKGKFVLLDIWGTWCGPCREALSHSTEEYARLKDFDIEFLYLANGSPQTAWEDVIKEYNVSGPNVAHYNLPQAQQAAIEHHLGVHAWPTYKLFDRDGRLLDLDIDARDLEQLAILLERIR